MDEQTQNELTRLAMLFWQEAESPTANDMDLLFTLLTERNIGRIRELCYQFGLDPEDGPVPFFIVVTFNNDTVVWNSVGWGHNMERMVAARKAIDAGNNEAEVRANLTKAGFTIVE